MKRSKTDPMVGETFEHGSIAGSRFTVTSVCRNGCKSTSATPHVHHLGEDGCPSWSNMENMRPVGADSTDPVNPEYYVRGGISFFAIAAAWALSFSRGSAVKYILRAGLKTPDPLPDLRKAKRCLEEEIARLEAAK